MRESIQKTLRWRKIYSTVSVRQTRTNLVPHIAFFSFLLCWSTFIARLDASDDSMWEASAKNPVPEGAKITLVFDRPEYFLGENVLVHFVLENAGNKPFESDWGGDYRGSSRHLRFKVTATDEAGQEVEDPDPSPTCFGGLGGPRTLKPGEKYICSLPLMRYRRIVQPGRYTVRATHDFGWKEGELKRPVGEASVTFKMPAAAEAERIVAQMEKLPEHPDFRQGERSPDYADFACLQEPVYLEPLVRRLRAGNMRALQGIDQIAAPEATEALIEMAGDADAKLALAAASTLNNRLPDPEFAGKLPGRGPFGLAAPESRRRFEEKVWKADFAPKVRKLAAKFLSSEEILEIACGAFMIRAVGTVEDAPVTLTALDRVLGRLVNSRRNPNDNILDLPAPIPELSRAMHALHSRGFELGEGLSGNGQIFIYFDWLSGEPPPRPPRWLAILDAFGSAGQYPLREAAIRSIPQPMPPSCAEFVMRGLADRDLGVCRAACTAAGKSGNTQFLKPLLEIIATENHEWLLREAGDAARSLGAGIELHQAWAERLADENLFQLALDDLQTVLEGPPNGWGGRTDLTREERLELREQWRDFLADHSDEIRQGKRFKITDPAVKSGLFGRARAWQLPDGSSWPKPSETPDQK